MRSVTGVNWASNILDWFVASLTLAVVNRVNERGPKSVGDPARPPTSDEPRTLANLHYFTTIAKSTSFSMEISA